MIRPTAKIQTSLVVLIVLVVISTLLNVRIMYERIMPVNAELQRVTAAKTDAAAAKHHLSVVVHDELARAFAMELSTVAIGIVAYITLQRSRRGYTEQP